MKRIKKMLSVILAILVLSSSIPIVGSYASESDKEILEQSNLMQVDSIEPSGFSTTTNPYGYDVGQPFLFSEENELMLVQTYNQSDDGLKSVKFFDGKSLNELNAYTNSLSGATDGNYDSMMPEFKGTVRWSLLQAVAFDPLGTGRKDHIAFVGYGAGMITTGSDLFSGSIKVVANVYTWVSDAVTGECKAYVDLGQMSWLTSDYEAFQSANFLDIAAGDFDGDGKDSVVVYSAQDVTFGIYDSVGCSISELSFDGENYTLLSRSRSLLNDYYMANQCYVYYDYSSDNSQRSFSECAQNKLRADIAVGDFNADGCDDIAVLSALNRISEENMDITHYQQPVKIVYGSKSTTTISDKSAAYTFSLANTPDDSEYTYIPVAASITAGDFDNNGYDDLFIAGMEGYFKPEGGKVDGYIEATDANMRVATILSSVKKVSGKKQLYMEMVYNGQMSANSWSESGLYQDQDDCWSPYAVTSVAINGQADRDYIFINGELFDLKTGTPQSLYKDSYFNKANSTHDNDSGITNTFMTSAVAGNFDGNDAGREQVVFVVGLKESGKDDYSFKLGYVGGTEFDDTEQSDGTISYGTAQSYTGTKVDDCSYLFSGKGDDIEEGLNCIIVDCDRDQDGILAKYRGPEYAYTDPDVKAVLQAAPYFSEISDSGNNATGYSIETTYELSQSSSDNVSYSFGFVLEVDTKFVASSIELGYCLDWTQSFEETLTETYVNSFEATAYDTVVVNRTPVFIYLYEVQRPDGTWGTTEEEKKENEIHVTIPQEPVYESMSVDKYNEFASAYNSFMSDNKDPGTWYELHEINEAENWLDNNEGNPYAYNQNGWSYSDINAKKISKSAITLGTNNTVNSVEWNESNASTVSTEMSHGFYFGLSILGGIQQVKGGAATNLEYSHGKGESVTNATAIGTSCSVNDIDGPSLLAAGVPQSVIDSYTFSWTLGQWERHLGGEDGHNTIFVGYSLENLNTPALSVTDLRADSVAGDRIDLTWSESKRFDNWPDNTGYYVYEVKDGTYTRISERLPAGTTAYTVKGLDGNTEYSFVVSALTTVDGKDKESMWSNQVTTLTQKSMYTVDIELTHEDAVEFKALHLGNVPIASGDKVFEDDTVTVTAKLIDERYSLEYIEITNSIETKKIYPDAQGTFAETIFIIESDTKITVNTKYRVQSSYVEFTHGEHGTVTATVDGYAFPSPGGRVSSSVIFTAKPNDGYVLKEWQITDANGNISTIDAVDRNPYTLIPTTSSYRVVPVYVAKEEATARVTVSVRNNIGGNIVVTDEYGNELVPDKSDNIYVPLGSVLTFTAVGYDGSKLSKWYGDAASQSDSSFEMKITKESTNITAEFTSVIYFKIYYGAEGEGSVSATAGGAYFLSGRIELPINQPVVFSARAKDGYVVKHWVVMVGLNREIIAPTQMNSAADELELVMTGQTDVTAVFEEKAVEQPEESTTQPEESTTQPEESTTQPEESTTQPEESTTQPEESTTQPEESTTQPEEDTDPENPDENEDEDGDGEDDGEVIDCDHICHSSNKLTSFFWKIIRFLQKIFGIEQYCECGRAHW